MRVMVMVLALGLVTSVRAEDPKATLAAKHGKIEVAPEAFRKAQLLTANAIFTAKLSCNQPPIATSGLALRVYDRQVGGPVYSSESSENTPFLAEAAGPWDPRTPAGTEVQVTFEPIAVPNKAPAELYFGYFQTCTTTVFHCCDSNGQLIKEVSTRGTLMGGGTFRLDCPGGKTGLCLYKQF